jgi:hypothetical protein
MSPWRALVVWSAVAACGAEGGGDDDDVTPQLRGACAADARVGGFQIVRAAAETQVTGAVADAAVTVAAVTEIRTSGDCTLLRSVAPFCDPVCTGGTLCADGACVPAPVNQDVGTVTIDGMLEPVSMMPTAVSYLYFVTSLPHPAYDAGGWLHLHADGGATSPFSLFGKGVDALALADTSWPLVREQALAIAWTPGSVPEAPVRVTLSVDQHGVTPASIHCDAADTGSLVVPGDMIAELLDLGISGFPSGLVSRGTADSADTELGCVDFAVASVVSADVSLPP